MIAVAAIFVAVAAMSAAVIQQRDRNWWRDQARSARDEAREAILDRDEEQAVVEVAEPAAWLERKIRHRIIVHTIDERSYEGLLELTAEDGVILVGTRMLTEGGMQVAGEVFIPRSQVLFVQLPRGEGD